MARKEIKSQGKDVATAIIKGLNELGRRRDQVEVTVIQEEKSGFLGIGGRPAIVRIIEKKWDSENSTPMKPRVPRSERPAKRSDKKPGRGDRNERGGDRKRKDFKQRGKNNNRRGGRVEKFAGPKTPKENEAQKLPSMEIQNAVIPDHIKEPMAEAKQTLSKILDYMAVKTENLNVWWDGRQERILITFDCDHPAVVIGKEGKTLESIQYIITLVISRHFDKPISVIADTQNYWRKLEDKINSEIDKAVSMVKRTKRDYRFRPMSAQIRRYVHRYVVDNELVETVSEGEGKWRKVVLKHSGKKAAKQAAAKTEEQKDVVEITPLADKPATSEKIDCAGNNPEPFVGEQAPVQEIAGVEPPVEIAPEVKEEIAALTPIESFEVNIPDAENASDVSSDPNETTTQENATLEATSKDLPIETHSGSRASTLESATSGDDKEDKSVLSADNAGQACVLTSESTRCEDVANVKDPQKAKIVHDAIHATTKTAEVEAKDDKSVVSPDNANESCVLTAETTNCEDVANVKDPEQAKIVDDAIHADSQDKKD